MSEILLPVFSSRIFMVLGLMFKSLIHFEFIPVCGIKWWSSFIFLHVSDQFSQYHLLNKPSLAHCMCWLPLSILSDYQGVVLFLGSLFIPLIYVSVFMPAPYCFENKCWWGCGHRGTFLHCWWECRLVQSLWKAVWR